jgi:Zn-dependent alcohol dehydrogenase
LASSATATCTYSCLSYLLYFLFSFPSHQIVHFNPAGVLLKIRSYAKALELVASGKIDVKPLVTHRYELDQVQEAFETAMTGRDCAIKVAINVQE